MVVLTIIVCWECWSLARVFLYDITPDLEDRVLGAASIWPRFYGKKVLQITDLNFQGNVIAVKSLDLGDLICDHWQELFT